MIDGVLVHPLKKIPDERGAVMHMLRCDDPHFEKFGEIYFSMVYQGAVKGWHMHREMTLNYVVVHGRILLVLYHHRWNFWQQIYLESHGDGYALVKIPPGVWNAFKGRGEHPSIVANCATLPYDEDEIVRQPIGYFRFDWEQEVMP